MAITPSGSFAAAHAANKVQAIIMALWDDWFGTGKKMIIVHQLHPILETFITRLWAEAGHVFSSKQILLPAKRGLISHVIKNACALGEICEINAIRIC